MYSLDIDFVAVKETMDYMVRALHGNMVANEGTIW